MTREEKFMNEAVLLSERGIRNNDGGPFGCVIVKDNLVIGRGYNQVISSNDPTAHAEIIAIRDACKNLGTFSLDGCEVYTSCEPCPMCLGAIYWARPKIIYYANTHKDAAAIGFDDSMIYEEINKDLKDRKIRTIHLESAEAKKIFLDWGDKQGRISY
jgi:tRNA(Arg) A34 adenosine deaminase TadA